MTVAQLRRELADLPSDMQVLVPTGADWRTIVLVRPNLMAERNMCSGYFTPVKRKGALLAVLLCPFDFEED